MVVHARKLSGMWVFRRLASEILLRMVFAVMLICGAEALLMRGSVLLGHQ
jgi:hypothetical protein